MIRMVLPSSEIPEFDKCIQLSAALARGEAGAERLTSADRFASATSSPSVVSRSNHRHHAAKHVHKTNHLTSSPKHGRRRTHHKHGKCGTVCVVNVVRYHVSSLDRKKPQFYMHCMANSYRLMPPPLPMFISSALACSLMVMVIYCLQQSVWEIFSFTIMIHSQLLILIERSTILCTKNDCITWYYTVYYM